MTLLSLLFASQTLAGPAKFDAALAPGNLPVAKITDFKDITGKAPYAATLQTVAVEWHAVGALKDGKFHPEMECTYGELASSLSTIFLGTLNAMNELDDRGQKRVLDQFIVPMMKGKKTGITSMQQVPTVAPTSPYFGPVRVLVETTATYIGVDGGGFQEFKAVSRGDLGEFGSRYFRDRGPHLSPADATALATRLQMLEMLGRGVKKIAKLFR